MDDRSGRTVADMDVTLSASQTVDRLTLTHLAHGWACPWRTSGRAKMAWRGAPWLTHSRLEAILRQKSSILI